MIHDGSQGYYQFFVDAVGTYAINLSNPPGYPSSVLCLMEDGVFNAPDALELSNPYILGSEDGDGNDFLDNFVCGNNPFYAQMLLQPGSLILYNNFSMA